MIERSVFGVELLPLILHVGQCVVGRTLGVQHGEAVAHQLALSNERVLYLRACAARTGDNADLLDIAQGVQAGAVLRRWVILPDVGVVGEGRNGVPTAVHPMSRGAAAAIGQDVHQRLRAEADAFQRGRPVWFGQVLGRVVHSDIPRLPFGATVGETQWPVNVAQYGLYIAAVARV